MNELEKNLIIIDGGIADAGSIAKAVSEEQEILILSENNGLAEVKAYLAARGETYAAIHFFTHGGDGVISLNGESITSDNLKAEDWAVIGSCLTEGGDLLFYGCEIAKSEEGKMLIDAIATAAKADAAASIDLTGKDGDWELEYVSGSVESRTITVAGYAGNLTTIYDNEPRGAWGGDVFTNCVFKNYISNGNVAFKAANTGTSGRSGFNQPITIKSCTFTNNEQALFRDQYRTCLYVNDTHFEYNSTYCTYNQYGQVKVYKGAAMNTIGEIRYSNSGIEDNRGYTEVNNSTFRYNVAGTSYAIKEGANWTTWCNNVKGHYRTETITISKDCIDGCYVDHRGCGGAILAYLNVYQCSKDVSASYKYNKDYGLEKFKISGNKNNTTFYRNSSIVDGGAIWGHRIWFTITDCSFTENTAGLYSYLELGQKVMGGTGSISANYCGSGGAIAAYDSTWIEFSGKITFTGNQADNYGGAISCHTPAEETDTKHHILKKIIKVIMTAVKLAVPGGKELETAELVDKAICKTGDKLAKKAAKDAVSEIGKSNGTQDSSGNYHPIQPELHFHSDAVFERNKTLANEGGAIYLTEQAIAMFDGTATFTNNSAGSDGGAVSIRDHNIFQCVEGVTCTGNTARDSGGAFFIYYPGASSVVIGGKSTFTRNSAGNFDGGAIRAHGTATLNDKNDPNNQLIINEVVFDGNSCGRWGGACRLASIDAHFLGEVTVKNNTAGDHGGGMSVSCNYNSYTNSDGNRVDISNTIFYENVTFSGNTAQYGGGLYVDKDTEKSASSPNLDSTVSGKVVFYKDVTFTGNKAAGDDKGNAMYITSKGWVKFSADMNLRANQTVVVNNNGILEWDITRDGGKTAYLNDYRLLTNNGGNMIITLNTRETAGKTSYILADNAANANGKCYLIKQGPTGKAYSKSANGNSFTIGKYTYTLGVNNNQLVLNVVGGVSKTQHEVIADGEKFFTDGNFSGYNNNQDSGGVFYVNANGVCDLYNAALTGNSAGTGGAIYNKGKLYLSNVTINSNTVKDSAQANGSGIYNNGGTVVFYGNVTCSDYITSNGGTIGWTVNEEKHGYLSDYSKLCPVFDDVAYTIDIDSSCIGTFKLASNAAAADKVNFTVNVCDVNSNGLEITESKTLTVNVSPQTLKNLCNVVLYTDANNDLWLSVSERIVVNKANFQDTNGVLTVKNEQNIVLRNYSGNGGVVEVDSDGTLNNTAPITFQKCSATGNGGIIYDNGGTVTLSDAAFTNNSANAAGGAIYNNGGTITITDSTFTGNHAAIGGAIYNNGTAILGNVTFSGNTVSGNQNANGGAIFNNTGKTLKLIGDVMLETDTDYITNYGKIEWVVNQSANGYISDYSKINNGSGWSYAVTIDSSSQPLGKYKLASHASAANGKSFTVSLQGSAAKQVSLTVNGGEKTLDENHRFTLYTNADNELWIDVALRITVSEAAYPDTDGVFTIKNGLDCSNMTYDGNGSVIQVEPDGRLNNTGSVSCTNCSATGNGGVIYNYGGVVTLSNATFTGNSATDGGAVYVAEGGKLTLADVVFSGNLSGSGNRSGAIYNSGTTTLTGSVTLSTDSDTIYNTGELIWDISTSGCGYISDFSKINNTASGTFVITGSSERTVCGTYKLADNAVDVGGYKFIVRGKLGDKTITVNGPTVVYSELCAAKLYTGEDNALYLQLTESRVVVNRANFTDTNGVLTVKNEQDIYGGNYTGSGGVVQVESDGTLNNTAPITFKNCSASRNGGVIYDNGGIVTLSNATFAGNYADSYGGHGGAIYNNGGVVTLTDSTFTGNSVSNYGGDGGAIYNESESSATITDSTFTGNFAGDGGAIFNIGTVNLGNVTFHGNNSLIGGAIYNTNGTITITASTFTSNHATYYGGAIYNPNGTITITASTFTGNRTGEGGAIYNQSSITITDSTFTGNSASDQGGAIFNEGGTITITDSTFTGNTAISGGAIYNNGTAILGNVTFSGNTVSVNQDANGGAIFNNTGKTLKLIGDVMLETDTDYITNCGTIEWVVNQSANGYISDYSKINNVPGGSYAVTINSSSQPLGKFKLASNASSANGKSFTVSLNGSAAKQVSLTVNGGKKFLDKEHCFTLYTDADNELWIEVILKINVTKATFPDTDGVFTIKNELNVSDMTYSGSGGMVYVENNGTLNNTAPITFKNCSASRNGGVIYDNGGIVTLSNATFAGNYAYYGGAIYNNGGVVTLTDSTFTGNSVSNYGGDGGAIYNTNGGTITITYSTFTGNRASNQGGAIYNNKGTITITDSTFYGNSSPTSEGTYYGGAIYNTNGTITITASTFTSNHATYYGGAIYNPNGTITITASTFTGNRVGEGGAIYNPYGTITITASTFSGNLAYNHGGAIYNKCSTVTITDSTFTGNRASTDHGGAIFNTDNGTITITDSIFTGNSVSWLDCGGAIYNKSGITTITDSIFSGNCAGEGGAIYNQSSITITASTFTGNSASDYGGAIYNESGITTITDSIFSGNSTRWQGGAIFNQGTVILGNVTFSGNTVSRNQDTNGGAIFNYGGNLKLIGGVTLETSTDTITNYGKIEWVVNPSANGYISDYSKINNVSPVDWYNWSYAVTINSSSQPLGKYKLASNASTANGVSFTVSLDGDAAKQVALTVNGGEKTLDENHRFTLYTDADNDLWIDVISRITVSEAAYPDTAGVFTIKNDPDVSNMTYDGNGSVIQVEPDGTLNNTGSVCFTNCSATGNGGVIYNNGGVVTLSDATFTGNSASGQGGAIYNNGTAILDNVTFSGNTASGNQDANGGAIFNNTGKTLKLIGDVMLETDTDYITNCGTIEWVVNPSANGYISDYSKIYNDTGWSYAVTIKSSQQFFCKYKLASNASTANGVFFTVSLDGDAAKQVALTVNGGEKTLDENHRFTLYTDADNDLWIDVISRITVSEAAYPDTAGVFTIQNGLSCSNITYDGNGSVIQVEPDGTLNNTGSVCFTNCSATGNGGVIYDNGGVVSLYNAAFTGNSATVHGGAIFSTNDGTITIIDSTFTGNSAGDGGAIYNESGTITITDSTFSGNSTSGQGGAIYNSGIIILGNVTFHGNTASGNQDTNGGAIFNNTGKTLKLIGDVMLETDTDYITNCGTIEWVVNQSANGCISDYSKINNVSDWSYAVTMQQLLGKYKLASKASTANGVFFTVSLGCDAAKQVAITVNGGEKTLEGNRISLSTDSAGDLWLDVESRITVSETAYPDTAGVFTIQNGQNVGNMTYDGNGGVIQVEEGGTLNNDGSISFTNCSATGNGGVICDNGGTVTLSCAAFTGNSATDGGGGAIFNLGTVNLGNVTFHGNSSYEGGAIYNESESSATITDSTFTGNFAGDGGAIFNIGTVNLGNVTFHGNNSLIGGAIYNLCGDITITGSTFTCNSALVRGGAIYNESQSSATITDSVFTCNTVSELGGAIFNAGTVILGNVIFSGNSASDGGAIYNYRGTVILGNVTFIGNSATDGGAIYLAYGSDVTLSDVTFSGNSATNGGAICVADGATLNIAGAVTFAAASDTIYNDGTLTLSGINNFAADIYSSNAIAASGSTLNFINTEVITVDAVLTGPAAIGFNGAEVVFARGVDLTGIVITIDCLPDANTTLVVASGVTNLDKASSFKLHGVDVNLTGLTDTVKVDGYDYKVTYDSASLSITVNAVVKAAETAGDITEDSANKVAGGYASMWTETTEITQTVFAAGSNTADNIYLQLDGINSSPIILGGGDGRECASREGKNDIKLTAGTVSTIYGGGFNQDQADVEIKLEGGTVTGDVFGGSRIIAGTHSVESVTMTIDQSVTSDGQSIYGAGFASGADVVLNNTETVIGIAGGNLGTSTAGEGVFGGGFAVNGAQVNTGNVTIGLTGGTVGNVFGGGWAQQGGSSTVDSVVINVSGDVQGGNIYGGGAHSYTVDDFGEKQTAVGSVAITIDNNTGFESVFAGGQITNTVGSDLVTGDAVITVSGFYTGGFTANLYGEGYNGIDTVGGTSTLNLSNFTGALTGKVCDFDVVKLSGDSSAVLGQLSSSVLKEEGSWILDYCDRTASGEYAAFLELAGGSFELLADEDLLTEDSWNLFSIQAEILDDDWKLDVTYNGESAGSVGVGGDITLGGVSWELLDVEPINQEVEPDIAYSKLVLSKKTIG